MNRFGDRLGDTYDDPGRSSSTTTRRNFVRAAGAGLGVAALGGTSGTAGAVVEDGVPTPRLHTDGRWIRDPDGNPVKLRGFATASLDFIAYDWYPWSVREILELATNRGAGWQPNHVRLPCEIEGMRAYGGVEPYVEEVLRPAVDYLRARNVYAMIDFHLIRPYTEQATEEYNADQDDEDDEFDPIDDVIEEFWSVVAPEFADDEHVLYELFNEPTYPLQWGEYGEEVYEREDAWLLWRDAAQPWVDMVREHAPETPIVIGSPDWTSETQFAPEHPFDGENLIYAAHIYPANGDPEEFDDEYGAPAEDVPVIVTEFGWDPNGGQIDGGTTSEWGEPFREWAEGYENVGWTAWCFDDSWAPTFFESPPENPQPGAGRPWALRDGEEEHGGYIKQWLAETAGDMAPESPIGEDVPPEPPTGLSVETVGETAATIAWQPATDPGDAGITHYEVTAGGETSIVLPSDGLETSLSGLEPSTAYDVSVVAVDDVGNRSAAATTTVETVPYGSLQEPYDGPNEIPGTVQAEDFDVGGQGTAYYDTTDDNAGGAYRDEAVDIEASEDDGYNVGYVEAGEWLEYSLDVETSGTYDLSLRAANGGNSTPDPAFRVYVDREAVGETAIWPTNGWQSWETFDVGEVDLLAGRRILRVAAESGGWNFDEFELELVEADPIEEAPATPADASVVETTDTTVQIDWSPVDRPAEYTVAVDGDGVDAFEVATTASGVTLTDLSPATAYDVSVVATNEAGESEPTTLSVTTDEMGEETPCEAVGAEAGEELANGDWVCDLDGDGNYRDLTASGDTTTQDLQHFFEHQHRDPWDSRTDLFDYTGNGDVGQPDVVDLFHEI